MLIESGVPCGQQQRRFDFVSRVEEEAERDLIDASRSHMRPARILLIKVLPPPPPFFSQAPRSHRLRQGIQRGERGGEGGSLHMIQGEAVPSACLDRMIFSRAASRYDGYPAFPFPDRLMFSRRGREFSRAVLPTLIMPLPYITVPLQAAVQGLSLGKRVDTTLRMLLRVLLPHPQNPWRAAVRVNLWVSTFDG